MRELLASLLVALLAAPAAPPPLRAARVAGTVTVEVEDPMPCMVERSEERPERGRGLAITRAVADSWGWYSTDAGKVVWARFVARGAVTATSRAPSRKAG